MTTSISIQSADERARSAIVDHHAELSRDLDQRVSALRSAVAASTPFEPAVATLAAFLADSLLPHAAAEERTLYPVAAADAGGALFVDGMVLEHRDLAQRTRSLAGASSAVDALRWAEGIAAVFDVHVRKENDVLLPALTGTPGVSLAALLEAMHDRLVEPAQERPGQAGGGAVEELDVRTLAHGSRHEIIFARLDALAAGGQLVIVNDHDPKPLRFQLDAAWPDTFDWDYLDAGPTLWRIAVTRRGQAGR